MRLAALKLAAEYARSIEPSGDISPEERRRIIDADWEQYREWLDR